MKKRVWNQSHTSIDLKCGTVFLRTDTGRWTYFDRIARKRISLGTADRGEALEIARRIEAQKLAIEAGLFPPVDKSDFTGGDSISLGECTLRYLSAAREDLTPDYFQIKLHYADDFIIPYFSSIEPLSSINSPRIAEFSTWLYREKRLSPVTRKKVLSTLSRILVYAVESGWISATPKIKWPKLGTPIEHGYCLDNIEIEALISAARHMREEYDPRYHSMLNFVALGLFCGLRHRTEILPARWEHLDWDQRIIRIPIQKNRTAMPAPFLRRAREILAETPTALRRGYIVFYLDPERRTLRRYKTWTELVALAGLDRIVKPDGSRLTPHDLRHTFATRMRAKLQYEAMKMTRHRDSRAFDAYDHLGVLAHIDAVDDSF